MMYQAPTLTVLHFPDKGGMVEILEASEWDICPFTALYLEPL